MQERQATGLGDRGPELARPATGSPSPTPRPLPADVLTALRQRLVDALGADWVYGDERRPAYRVDDLTPALVAAPGSAEEVAAALALANDAGAAVVPWG